MKKPDEHVVAYRCKLKTCQCSPDGKLLIALVNPPKGLVGSGVEIQVACPKKKSRLVRVKL